MKFKLKSKIKFKFTYSAKPNFSFKLRLQLRLHSGQNSAYRFGFNLLMGNERGEVLSFTTYILPFLFSLFF